MTIEEPEPGKTAHYHQYVTGWSQYHDCRRLAPLESNSTGLSVGGHRWSLHQKFAAVGVGLARAGNCRYPRAIEQHTAVRTGLCTLSVLIDKGMVKPNFHCARVRLRANEHSSS